MRIAKKMLCLALAVMMIASCMAQVAFATEETSGAKVEFSDVAAGAEYADAVSVLNLMGVINGYEDGTFKPDKDVTRAEFTAMLMRTLNLGSVGSPSAAGLPFTDVLDTDSSISWSIPNINTAYGMKIINGYEDSTFRPNANVAFEEAVKMIVCTLGYGEGVDVSVAPWYANYISIATQIGLLKNANQLGQTGTPASRACIAQMLYDALEIKIIENGERTDKTILSDYMGYIKNTGVITSNSLTSLEYADANLRDDEIQISAIEPDDDSYETHTYSTIDESLKDYLGYGVEFYYKDSTGIRDLVLCVVKNSSTLEINAANIETGETTDTTIKYYKNLDDSKPATANLESDNVVVLNGKLYGNTAAASRFSADISDPDTRMIPAVGKMTLVDSDNNNKYDVVFVDKVDIYYVSNKVSSTYEIIDNVLTGTQRKLKLDVDSDKYLEIVNEEGKEIKFSAISNGNIICYTKSNGSNALSKAVVLTDKVSGTVSSIKGEKITISGKEYRCSPAASWLNGGSLEEPETQLTGTFYLDLNGDIIAYDKTQSGEKYTYGYILTYGVDENTFDGDAVIEVLTQTGTTTRIGTYAKTKVDGKTCSTGTEVIDALLLSGDNQYKGEEGAANDRQRMQQLIKYTTKKSDGITVFDKIVTAEDQESETDIEDDTLLYYDTLEPGDSLKYNNSSKTLSGEGSTLKVSSTIVFSIPENRNDFDAFKKSTASGILKNDKSYSVEAFDVKTNVPKVIVIHGVDNSQSVDYSTPLYVLADSTSVAENTEVDKNMIKIEGAFEIGPKNSSIEDIWLSNDSSAADLLDIGDVFRAGTDKYGFYDVDAIMLDADGSNDEVITDENGDEVDVADIYEGECVNIVGSVKEKDDDNVVITGDFGDITFAVSEFSKAKILVYIEEGKTTEVREESDYGAAIASLTASEDTGDVSSKVLIYMADGDIQLIYILPAE